MKIKQNYVKQNKKIITIFYGCMLITLRQQKNKGFARNWSKIGTRVT